MYESVHLSTPKAHSPPESVHCGTLNSRRLRPGTNRTCSSRMSCGGFPETSSILILAVPIECACTMLPLATSTKILDLATSDVRSLL